MSFERFGPGSRRVLVASHQEALGLGHATTTSAHLLIGLSFVEDSSAGRVLAGQSVRPGAVRRALLESAPLSQRRQGRADFSPDAKRAMTAALTHAEKASSYDVRSAHLLLGVLDDDASVGAQVLDTLGVNRSRLREQALDELGRPAEEPASTRIAVADVLPYLSFAVWSLMATENRALLYQDDPDFVRCYRVPGTPDGLGGHIATVRRVAAGQQTSVDEVVAYDRGLRVVTERLEPYSAPPMRSTTTLEPVDRGTRVELDIDIMLPAPGSAAASDRLSELYEQSLQDYLRRLRGTLDAGWRPLAAGSTGSR